MFRKILLCAGVWIPVSLYTYLFHHFTFLILRPVVGSGIYPFYPGILLSGNKFRAEILGINFHLAKDFLTWGLLGILGVFLAGVIIQHLRKVSPRAVLLIWTVITLLTPVVAALISALTTGLNIVASLHLGAAAFLLMAGLLLAERTIGRRRGNWTLGITLSAAAISPMTAFILLQLVTLHHLIDDRRTFREREVTRQNLTEYRETTRNLKIMANSSTPSPAFLLQAPLSTSDTPHKVKVVDIDGDQKLDLLVGFSGPGGYLRVLTGNNTGRFRLRQTLGVCANTLGVNNLALGDIDGDGDFDVLVSCKSGKPYGIFGISVLAENMGKGGFRISRRFIESHEPIGVALADMDGDGLVDVLTSSLFPGDVRLRRNLGNWRFGAPVIREAAPDGSFGAYFIEVGDIDQDGRPDLVFPQVYSPTVSYMLNDGNLLDPRKSVKLRHLSSASKQINNARLVDLNRDGYLDIVTANHVGDSVSVFMNAGDGTFKKELLHRVGNAPAMIAFADLNSNGWIDIIASHWQDDFITVLMNRGDGHLLQGKEYKIGPAAYGVDTGDLNGDGHVDIVTANSGSVGILLGLGNGQFRLPPQHLQVSH